MKEEVEENNGDIDETDLKELLDVMVWETAGVVYWIKALNLLANYNIEGYKEENNDRNDNLLRPLILMICNDGVI